MRTPPKSRFASLALRTAFAAATLLLASPVCAPALAFAEERPVTASILSGVRFFDDELGLEDDILFGIRLGVGLSQRWGIVLDFVASHPNREVTQTGAYIDALRAMCRANILTGKLRPYALMGAGGIMFLFDDAPSTGQGALTVGVGADYRIASRAVAFLEGSVDFYRSDRVYYTPTGQAYLARPEETETLGAISLGVGMEF